MYLSGSNNDVCHVLYYTNVYYYNHALHAFNNILVHVPYGVCNTHNAGHNIPCIHVCSARIAPYIRDEKLYEQVCIVLLAMCI